jgi:hypothetical protein
MITTRYPIEGIIVDKCNFASALGYQHQLQICVQWGHERCEVHRKQHVAQKCDVAIPLNVM